MAHLAQRLDSIQPFRVMEILSRARQLEAQGRSIIHMEIGEPDFPTPPQVVKAGIEALENGMTHYLPALGLPELRQAIADSYRDEVGVDPAQVVLTPGASGALQLIFGTLIDAGDEVILADPGYPCNRHIVTQFGGRPVAVAVGPEEDFQLTLDKVKQHWTSKTRAVLVASPSNPTGTIVPEDAMQAIAEFVQSQGGVLVVDEIYRHLSYERVPITALNYPGEVFVVNSFSKYQGMTGWRLGWLVSPPEYVDAIERLAQNIFIAAATPAQYAALATFQQDTILELEQRRRIFQQRRDFLMPALTEIGFEFAGWPQGAFYLYAECSKFADDSHAFVLELLEQAGVAVTPGIDFGDFNARRYVRFSYANSIDSLREGVRRIGEFLDR